MRTSSERGTLSGQHAVGAAQLGTGFVGRSGFSLAPRLWSSVLSSGLRCGPCLHVHENACSFKPSRIQPSFGLALLFPVGLHRFR